MRKPFKESMAELKAEGRRYEIPPVGHVVACGDVLALHYSAGSSYSNQGRVYVPASLRIQTRWNTGSANKAWTGAMDAVPGAREAFADVPRNDAAARRALEVFRIVDAKACELLLEIEAEAEAAANILAATRAARDSEARHDRLAATQVSAEVISLLRGGHLEGEAFAALHGLATELAALREAVRPDAA